MGTSYRELFKLYDLIQSGEARSVEQYLAENSMNVNEILWCKNIGVLHLAVGIEPEEKSIQCTEILLKHGADANLCNNDGITPVHIAAIWGRVDNLKLLMGCGGHPYILDMNGQSAFDYAAKEEQWDVYDYLHNVVDELDDSFSSSCAYSLELEKVLMTTDQMVAEYEPITDNQMPATATIRKTEMVREWCEKSSLVMNKLYPTILSETFTLDTDSAPFRSINFNLNNMTLDLTADVASKSFEETNNTFNTCLSKPLWREVEITGIKQLNVTSDDSISCTNKSSESSNKRLSIYENFSLPGSPNQIIHRNYNSKSSLRRKNRSKESTNSDLQILPSEFSQSMFTEDCSRDLNQALEVSQNETNERLSSGNTSNDCKNTCSCNCKDNCKNKSCTCQATNKKVNQHNMSQLMSELKQKLQIRDDKSINTGQRGPDKASVSLTSHNSSNNHSISHKLHNKATCTSPKLHSKDLLSSKLHSNNSVNSNEVQPKDIVSNESHIKDLCDINNTRRSSASSGVSSNYSGGSIVIANVEEVYKYEDKEEDVVLIEKRLLVSSVVLPVDDAADSPDQTIISVASSLPPSVEYDNGTLRQELIRLGFTPGPIQDSTRTLYLKKLHALKRNPIVKASQGKTYSIELEKSLRCEDWLKDLSPYMELEDKARVDFSNPNKKWREGTTKTSFTYLLLDPRLTDNLPVKASKQTSHVSWITFVNSIFYVGKGKRSRPYSHLYQALELWKRNFTSSKDKKVQHILDIWSDKMGVVCLHIFQNVIPAEAYTYEAAMIDVLGVNNLTNLKSGNYYGAVASWPHKERRMLGLYLLYKAMRIFLSEGERQLRPEDID